MLKVERAGKRLAGFGSFRVRPLGELYELADFVLNSPEEFFAEIGEELFVLEAGDRREGADLLAADREGAVAVIVIEPDRAGPAALSRALAAAGRVGALPPDDLWRRLSPRRAAELKRFLTGRAASLNHAQRVFVVSEAAEEALLSTAAWLRSRGGVDVVCVEVRLGADPKTDQEYLFCRRVGGEVVGSEATAPLIAPAEEPTAPEATVPTEPPAEPPSPVPPPPSPPAAPQEADAGPHPSVTVSEDDLADRRTFRRRQELSIRGLRVFYGGRELGAQFRDYSRGGVGVEMNTPLPVGSSVRVEAVIGSDGAEEKIAVDGRVRHCKFGASNFELGISFDELQPELL